MIVPIALNPFDPINCIYAKNALECSFESLYVLEHRSTL